MALTEAQIKALLSSTRSKGQYTKYLNDFVNSGEAGVCVNEQWADLAGKKASTLKQGFENAKGNKEAVEGAEYVKVIVSGETDAQLVYLINLKAAGVEAPEAAE